MISLTMHDVSFPTVSGAWRQLEVSQYIKPGQKIEPE